MAMGEKWSTRNPEETKMCVCVCALHLFGILLTFLNLFEFYFICHFDSGSYNVQCTIRNTCACVCVFVCLLMGFTWAAFTFCVLETSLYWNYSGWFGRSLFVLSSLCFVFEMFKLPFILSCTLECQWMNVHVVGINLISLLQCILSMMIFYDLSQWIVLGLTTHSKWWFIFVLFCFIFKQNWACQVNVNSFP